MVETSNEHNFLPNKAFLTILSAVESLDIELSKNLMLDESIMIAGNYASKKIL